jgi:hypothetical protein
MTAIFHVELIPENRKVLIIKKVIPLVLGSLLLLRGCNEITFTSFFLKAP